VNGHDRYLVIQIALSILCGTKLLFSWCCSNTIVFAATFATLVFVTVESSVEIIYIKGK